MADVATLACPKVCGLLHHGSIWNTFHVASGKLHNHGMIWENNTASEPATPDSTDSYCFVQPSAYATDGHLSCVSQAQDEASAQSMGSRWCNVVVSSITDHDRSYSHLWQGLWLSEDGWEGRSCVKKHVPIWHTSGEWNATFLMDLDSIPPGLSLFLETISSRSPPSVTWLFSQNTWSRPMKNTPGWWQV